MESVNYKKTEIHPTAVVHPWARIGDGVKIGPYSVIGESVEIGNGCVIGSNVLVEGVTKIGKNNVIYHGASVGTPPQDLKYGGGRTQLIIGDDNTIREYVTLNTATKEGEKTVVGSGCLLMAYSHVAHNCDVGDHVILANSVNLAGHVLVGEFVIIGGMTPVHQFVRIGQHAFVGGATRIEMDIPPFMKVGSNPPRVYGVNTVGLERRGFSVERRANIKKMYKILYRSNLNVAQALEALGNGDFNEPDRTSFINFLKESKRGIQK